MDPQWVEGYTARLSLYILVVTMLVTIHQAIFGTGNGALTYFLIGSIIATVLLGASFMVFRYQLNYQT